jgi:hypothetical protein
MNSNESNGKDYGSTLIEYWMEKSRESMEELLVKCIDP